MKLQDYLNQYGAEKTAYKLIDIKITNILGIGLESLPETSILAEYIEEIADILQDDPTNTEAIKEILNNIDLEFIEELIYG